MKIYTKTGDGGSTSLFSGGRVPKDDIRVEAYGTVDELVSLIGLLLCEALPAEVVEMLVAIQNSLFVVGSVLADPEGRMTHDPDSWSTVGLEAWIDVMEARVEPLTAFILPGGGRAASLTHVVRTVCRRAEGLAAYLNRLSDAFFVLARFLNAGEGIAEIRWRAREEG